MEKLGRLTYVRYRPLDASSGEGDPRWDLYDACVHLAERSWQNSSADGNTLSHPEVRDFLRDAHEAAAKTGCLDLNLLLLDDRPAAFVYGYWCQGRITALRMGYEPELAAVGPGTVLQRLILQDSFQRGDVLYDLGPGAFHYKRHWQTKVATAYYYTYYPLSVPRVQLIRLKRWLRKWFRPDYAAYSGSA